MRFGKRILWHVIAMLVFVACSRPKLAMLQPTAVRTVVPTIISSTDTPIPSTATPEQSTQAETIPPEVNPDNLIYLSHVFPAAERYSNTLPSADGSVSQILGIQVDTTNGDRLVRATLACEGGDGDTLEWGYYITLTYFAKCGETLTGHFTQEQNLQYLILRISHGRTVHYTLTMEVDEAP